MHKDYCNYPNDPCDCKYFEKQKYHSYTCEYPKEPCTCNIGKSQQEIDSKSASTRNR